MAETEAVIALPACMGVVADQREHFLVLSFSPENDLIVFEICDWVGKIDPALRCPHSEMSTKGFSVL